MMIISGGGASGGYDGCGVWVNEPKTEDESSTKINETAEESGQGKLSANPKNTIKAGTSVESCDSEKGSSPNSMISSVTTSLHFGHSIESTEGFSDKGSSDSHKDTNSFSR